jgi:ubiquinone biosynthesis protein
LVKDFSRTIQKELSMSREANNIATFQENFKDNSDVIFPQVVQEFSTQRILTMKFEEGKGLNHIDNSVTLAQRKRLAAVGAEMYLNMIFRDNFYHGDPHPGNILLSPEGKLVLLDFGMIGSLNSTIFNELEEFLFAIVNHDSEGATESIYVICEVDPNVVKSELVNEIDYWIREYISQNVSNISTADAMADLNLLINKFQIVMPGNMALLFKVLVQLDGTARLLDPDFNVMDALKSFYVKMFKYRYSPQNVAKKVFLQSRDWIRVMRILPKALSRNLDAINAGDLHLNLQHKGLENSVNRLVLGIIAASLFLGSVILWSLNVPPLVYGASLFGILGYAAAIILIYKLMRDIFKQPKK